MAGDVAPVVFYEFDSVAEAGFGGSAAGVGNLFVRDVEGFYGDSVVAGHVER